MSFCTVMEVEEEALSSEVCQSARALHLHHYLTTLELITSL